MWPRRLKKSEPGGSLIVVDDEDRENEGDLTLAADCVTPEIINFMARYGRGLICTPLHPSYFERLSIPLMVSSEDNSSKYHTNFGTSVGAATGVTTGISAADRARTIQVLTDPASRATDLSMPGHVFPIRARENGVLERRGHTEAAIDLARLAGLSPAGVICEILNEDGTMARLPQLEIFAEEHNLKIVSIESLVAYRRQHESIVSRTDTSSVTTAHGEMEAVTYLDHKGLRHLALCKGDLTTPDIPVRLHSAEIIADLFGAPDDGQLMLDWAMKHIADAGHGIFLYLAQAHHDPGLVSRGPRLSHSTLLRETRGFDVGASILRDLGVGRIRLIASDERKRDELRQRGIDVSGLVGPR